MTAFTVATEACQAQFNWTGVETQYPCGFPALAATHLVVQYTTGTPAVTTTLAIGVAYSVALDPISGNATVNPISAGMPAPSGTVTITRLTPATQQTQFANLATYSPDIHTQLADQAEMGIAELKRRASVLEQAAFGTLPVPPASYVNTVRTQRAIGAGGGLPITATDQIVNINAASDLTPVVPAASTRGGMPLTIKNVAGSHAQTLLRTGTDTFDGQVTQLLVSGAAITLNPFNDGVNSGYFIT